MNKRISFNISGGVATIVNGGITVEMTEGSLVLTSEWCGGVSVPEFVPNTEWPTDASSSLRFSFVAGSCGTDSVGFGLDSCGEYGTVNEFPNGLSAPDNMFSIHYRRDLNRSYVHLGPLSEDVPGRVARVTVTHAATGVSQTFLGATYSGEFQVQADSTLVLEEGELYYVEFAVADGGG